MICSRNGGSSNQCWFECSCDLELSCNCDQGSNDYCRWESEIIECGCDDFRSLPVEGGGNNVLSDRLIILFIVKSKLYCCWKNRS